MKKKGQPITAVNASNADIPLYGVVVERPALRGVLEDIRRHRVTLVSAPPGYGKTTAIANFALDVEMPTAWHSLHERERDLPALFAHSLHALEFVAPGISVAAKDITSPDECAGYIAGYLREHLTRHVVYVMDDLHFIAAAPQVEQWLRELVRQLPAMCHLVLISRSLPDLPLAELIARGDVLAIGQEQLQFTPADASALATMVGVELSDEALSARVRHLEGWPVGVAMSLRPLPADLQVGLLRGNGGPEALFDALANGLLKSLPPVLGDFLLTSSTFSRVTPTLCSEILGLQHIGAIMQDLVRRNLFVSQVSGGIMLHRLFRNYLQRRLKDGDPKRYKSLHSRAAEWHRKEHQDDEAFEHYVEAGRIDDALDIVQRMHRSYYQQGKLETLLRWRASLAADADRLPDFVFTCAMILTDRYMFNDALSELDAAEAGAAAQENWILVDDVRLQRARIYLWRGDYRAARELAEPLATDTQPPFVAAGAKHVLALVELAVGDLDAAIDFLEGILPLYEDANDSYYVSGILQDLSIAYGRAGDITAASHCLQRLVSIRRTLGQSNALALALNNLGCHYHKISEYDLALRTFEDGLQVIGQTTNQRAESYIRWSLGDLQRDLANDDAAMRLYESAYELSSGAEPLLQQSIAVSMATLYRWRGEKSLAAGLMRDVVEELTSGDTQDMGISLVAQANHIILYGEETGFPAARQALEALLERLSHQRASADYVQISLLAALAALCSGDESGAASHLRWCAGLADKGIARHIAAAEIVHSSELSAFVLQRKRDFSSLQSAVDRLRTARAAQSPAIRPDIKIAPAQTYSLRVLTLGSDLVECDGVPITTSEWRSSRAKEFFFYLLFEGAVTREKLSLVFWPDSSTSRVRSNFHTTLHRARRALGDNVIQFENEVYRINPAVSVWCDAQIVRRNVREAQMLPYSDVRADDLYREAAALCRGDFLDDLDAEWIIGHRESLFELHISALMGTGHCARARQDYDGAIALFKRALKLDPYREEAYRALFTCYAGMGELNYVLKQYDVMSSIFQADLGIRPSPETHAHVRQLTQHVS